MSPVEIAPNPEENRNQPPACRTFVENGVRNSAKAGPDEGPIDPDLAAVISAWDGLPQAIKARILEMVLAADQ